MNITIVGAGRCGTSFDSALRSVGHHVTLLHHDETHLVRDADLVLLSVPDDAIAATARSLPTGDYVVAHVAGSRTLEVLSSHAHVASLHPLVALPSREVGAQRLLGATYCVAGHPTVAEVAATLGGRVIALSDDQRTTYHATAVVAANHLVALMGHVQTLASSVGLALEDFLPLASQALSDVIEVGPTNALTGPASRGDMATIDAHLASIPEAERSTYVAMANKAFELAEQRRVQLPAN